MRERTLHRIGAGAAMLGAVLALVFNLLHPRISDFQNPTRSLLEEAAASDAWTGIHVGLLLASLLIVLGLFVLARSLGQNAGEWSRLALGALVVSGAVVVTTLAVDGYAVKEAADVAVAGAGQGQAAALAAGLAVENIGWGMFMLLILTFLGLTPLTYGLAVRADGTWPAAFGWPIVALGLASIVEALVGTLDGASEGFFLAFSVTSILLTAWVFVAGVLLWRRAPDALVATAPARRRPPAKRPAARRTRG